MSETNELNLQAQVKVDDASETLLQATQTDGPKSDNAQNPVTNESATVSASVSTSHDLAALVLGGVIGWGVYRENKQELDPVIETAGRIAMEANTMPLRSLERLGENIVNKPLTTALEFIVFPGLPALHASLSAASDSLKK